jgi:hypothetical protein
MSCTREDPPAAVASPTGSRASPLASLFVPPAYGKWAVKGGDVQVIGTLGLAFTYELVATDTLRARGRKERAMLDVLYIGLALGFLAISWALVELCDRL